jgi:cytoskeletal protein RodZ
MKKPQTGSAHVVIIIVLVIAVLGLLGFVFWQNFIKAKPATTATTSTTTSTTKETATDPYAGWQTYTDKSIGFNVKYPSDWKQDISKNSSLVLNNLISPAIAAEQPGAPDAATSDVTIQTEPKSGPTGPSSSGAIGAVRSGNIDGYAYAKYSETVNNISVTELNMISQTGYYAAVYLIGSNYVELDFNTAPTKSDMTDTFNKILTSVNAV